MWDNLRHLRDRLRDAVEDAERVKSQARTVGAWLKPAMTPGQTPSRARGVTLLGAAAGLIIASGVSLAAVSTLLVALLFAWLLLSRVFGVSLDLDLPRGAGG